MDPVDHGRGRIWVNIIAKTKHEEHTVWNGFVKAEEVMVVVSPQRGGE